MRKRELENLISDDLEKISLSSELDLLLARNSLDARIFNNVNPRIAIGRYLLVRRLAHGGMGSLYEAMDPELGRRVAIKISLNSSSASRGDAKIRSEAQALARFNHRSIVHLLDVGVMGVHPYLVLEYINGMNLVSWARSPKANAISVLWILTQVAHGLCAIHRNGIVHSDIKPSNVMVTGVSAKIIDFGLSVSLETREGLGGRSEGGTHQYMAPEQRRNKRVTPLSDQYSFFMTASEMIASLPDHLAEEVKGLRTGTISVLALLERGLRARPQHRWKDMVYVAGIFRECLAEAIGCERAVGQLFLDVICDNSETTDL